MSTAEEVVNEALVELCLFSSDGVTYAAPIEYITDIIELCPITFVPGLPDYMRGIINLRGKIVPVMDLRIRENKNSGYTIKDEYPQRACIVVIRREEVSCGLLVERVEGISHYDTADLAKNTDKGSLAPHILTTDNGQVRLIDTMRIQMAI